MFVFVSNLALLFFFFFISFFLRSHFEPRLTMPRERGRAKLRSVFVIVPQLLPLFVFCLFVFCELPYSALALVFHGAFF